MKTVKSAKPSVTSSKHMKNYKSLYTFRGSRCVNGGKSCGMELRASPSREITTVVYGVLKEGHAFWSKGLCDFSETAPGVLLSPSEEIESSLWDYEDIRQAKTPL